MANKCRKHSFSCLSAALTVLYSHFLYYSIYDPDMSITSPKGMGTECHLKIWHGMSPKDMARNVT